MESKEKQNKKVVFNDGDRQIAITGKIISEDDFFIVVINRFGKEYRIGKKSICVIKDSGSENYGN